MGFGRLFKGAYGPLLALAALVGVLWTGSYTSRPYHHNSIPTWTPSALVVPLWRTDGDLDVTTVVSFDVEGCGASLCPPTWSADLPGQPMGQGAAAGDVFYVTSMQSFAAFPTACTAVCAPLYVQDEDVWTWFGSPIVANGLVLHAPGGDLQALSLP